MHELILHSLNVFMTNTGAADFIIAAIDQTHKNKSLMTGFNSARYGMDTHDSGFCPRRIMQYHYISADKIKRPGFTFQAYIRNYLYNCLLPVVESSPLPEIVNRIRGQGDAAGAGFQARICCEAFLWLVTTVLA